MEPILGQVIMFAGNFAPKGWAICNGQLLAVDVHKSLFTVLGTQYGGDGYHTFALPDLRGKFAIQHGPSLPSINTQKEGHHASDTNENMETNYVPLNYIIALKGAYPAKC